MMKFIKTCLFIGLLLLGIGFVVSKVDFSQVNVPKVEFADKPFFELEEQAYFNNDVTINVDEEVVKESFLQTDVRALSLKTSGITIEIMEYDGEDILVEAQKVHKFQTYLDKEELKIIGRGQAGANLSQGKVVVSIPSTLCNSGDLDLDIESSASVISFDKLVAKDVELSVSAGTISWQELSAMDLSVEMTAGTVKGSTTFISNETELKLSAGVVSLTGQVGVETEIETKAGKVEITLTDVIEAYNYDISCTGGSVAVGDQKIEGLAKSVKLENGAKKHMDIECSVGVVSIALAEAIPDKTE